MHRRTICPALLSPRRLPREVETDPLLIFHKGALLLTRAIDTGDARPLIAAASLGTPLTSLVSLCPHAETIHQRGHLAPFLYVFIINRTHKTPGCLCIAGTWAEVSLHTPETQRQDVSYRLQLGQKETTPPSHKKPLFPSGTSQNILGDSEFKG